MKKDTTRRAGLALAAALIAGSTVAAHARPDVRDLSCREARALVRDAGAIVMTTGRHTYDRFVSSEAYCDYGLFANRAWVETRDRRSCRVGYTCTTVDPFGFRD